jgi:hypothetical protein
MLRSCEAAPTLSRLQDAFPDNVLIRLPRANHFIREDAPEAIATAISQRFWVTRAGGNRTRGMRLGEQCCPPDCSSVWLR